MAAEYGIINSPGLLEFENTTVLGNPPKIFPNSAEKICWVNHKGYPTWSRSVKY